MTELGESAVMSLEDEPEEETKSITDISAEKGPVPQKHTVASPKYTKVRILVSGTPFDIPWTQLEEWKDTTIYGSAMFSIKSGRFIDNGEGKQIPLVVDDGDPYLFRIIRNYMNTKELILPPDRVTRQLLSTAAVYYGFDVIVKMIALECRTVERKEENKHADREFKKKESSPVDLGNGTFVPSRSALRTLGVDVTKLRMAEGIARHIEPFWRSGEEDLAEIDTNLRTQEHKARVLFGRDEDATELIRSQVAVLLSRDRELESLPHYRTDYQRLIYPSTEILPTDVRLVTTLEQFETQFHAMSEGLLDGILETLPLVVAGGSVLTCLHRLPRVITCENELEMFLSGISQFARTMDDGPRAAMGLPPRVIRKETKTETEKETKEPEEQMNVGEMNMRARAHFMRMYRLHSSYRDMWKRDLDLKGEDPTDRVQFMKHMALIWKMHLTEEHKKQIYQDYRTLLASHPKLVGAPSMIMGNKTTVRKAAPRSLKRQINTDRPPIIVEGGSPTGFSYKAIDEMVTAMNCYAQPMPRRRSSQDDVEEIKIAFKPEDIDRLGLCLFLRGITMDDGMTRRRSLSMLFNGGRFTVDNGDYKSWVILREPILKDTSLMRAYQSFRTTDIDLFLTTRDPDEALKAIERLHAHLVSKCGENFNIVRTAQSVTFQTRNVKIQVITRLYFSPEHAILGFDLDPCCVAYDGRRVIALPRALRSLSTRMIIADPTRQSTSYEARLLKYAKRGFSIAVPGLDIVAQMKAVLNKITMWKTTKQYVGLAGVQQLLGMLYAVTGDKAARKLFRFRLSDYNHIESCVDRIDEQPNIADTVHAKDHGPISFVYGTELQKVLASNVFTHTSGRITVERLADIPPVITFQLHAPHVQDRTDLLFTGAFHPTSYDWYNGDDDKVG